MMNDPSASRRSLPSETRPELRENSDESLQHVVAGDFADPALVPAAGFFEGQVVLQGETRIEGSVRGALRGPGRLAVGPGGRIEGAVECSEVASQGFISGSVAAVGGVWLGPGSRIEGPIRSSTLALDETAIWNGQASVGPPKSER